MSCSAVSNFANSFRREAQRGLDVRLQFEARQLLGLVVSRSGRRNDLVNS